MTDEDKAFAADLRFRRLEAQVRRQRVEIVELRALLRDAARALVATTGDVSPELYNFAKEKKHGRTIAEVDAHQEADTLPER